VNKKAGNISYSISFSSVKIANSLRSYGIVPNKWFIVKINGGLENNRDLWRGIIDGDGHIGIHSSIPCISLTGSLRVCLQFKTFLEHQLGISMPNLVSYKNSYSISVSGHRAVRAIKLLYENCTVALDRKLVVARKIMDLFQIRDN
jgi:hypothetical protein